MAKNILNAMSGIAIAASSFEFFWKHDIAAAFWFLGFAYVIADMAKGANEK